MSIPLSLRSNLELDVLQQLLCGARFDSIRYPRGAGRLPAMPALVARVQVQGQLDSHSICLPYRDQLVCRLELFDQTGQTQLPDDLFFEPQTARCHEITSMHNAAQTELWFVFGEIVLRECGIFRLRVILQDNNNLGEITSILSAPFQIVEYEQFPGVARGRVWTRMSQHIVENSSIILHSPGNPEEENWDIPALNGI